jgi:hypothetical protein
MSTGLFFSIWIPTMVIGLGIGNIKGRTVAGLVLTAALGLIGLVILLFLPRTEAKKISNEAERQRIEAAAKARNTDH